MTAYIENYEKLKQGNASIKLKNYQISTIEKIKNNDVYAVFFEQGLGKTITALSAFAISNCDVMVTIVAPLIIANSWEEDIQKSGYDFGYYIWRGKNTTEEIKKRIALLKNKNKKKIIIFNIDILSTYRSKGFVVLNHMIEQYNNMMLCIDQSQAIKNIKSNRTRNLIDFGKSEKFRKKIILEGASNNEGNHELYSQFYFLNPNIIGSKNYYHFTTNFCEIEKIRVPASGGIFREVQKIKGNKNEKKLMEKIKKYTTWKKREKNEVVYKKITIEAGEEEQKIFDFFTKEKETKAFLKICKENKINEKTAEIGMIRLMRLHQISSGCFNLKSCEKTKQLKKLFEYEIPIKNQVLIFCSYKKEIENVYNYLSCYYNCKKLVAEDSEKIRNEIVKNFQNKKIDIVVTSPPIAGVGLNFGNVESVVFHSMFYSSRVREESIARINRLNSTTSSVVYDLLLFFENKEKKYSIDEKIYKIIKNKEKIKNKTFDIFSYLTK